MMLASFFVVVGSGIHRFLDKLTIDDGQRPPFVIPAVNAVHLRPAAVFYLNTVFDGSGRVAICAGFAFLCRFEFPVNRRTGRFQ